MLNAKEEVNNFYFSPSFNTVRNSLTRILGHKLSGKRSFEHQFINKKFVLNWMVQKKAVQI